MAFWVWLKFVPKLGPNMRFYFKVQNFKVGWKFMVLHVFCCNVSKFVVGKHFSTVKYLFSIWKRNLNSVWIWKRLHHQGHINIWRLDFVTMNYGLWILWRSLQAWVVLNFTWHYKKKSRRKQIRIGSIAQS